MILVSKDAGVCFMVQIVLIFFIVISLWISECMELACTLLIGLQFVCYIIEILADLYLCVVWVCPILLFSCSCLFPKHLCIRFVFCIVASFRFGLCVLYFSCHKTESSFDRKCLLNLFQLVECFIRSVVIINVSSCMVLNWLFINRILIGSIGLCSYYLFAFGLVALKIAFW